VREVREAALASTNVDGTSRYRLSVLFSCVAHIFRSLSHLCRSLSHHPWPSTRASLSKSLRRFCQPVCYSIKEAIPFEAIPLDAVVCGMLLLQWARLGPDFDKYLWECLYLFCEKDDDPPKLHKCEKCEKRPSLPRTLMAQAGTIQLRCTYFSFTSAFFFEAIPLNAVVCGMLLLQWARLGPEFDKYLWECLCVFCGKDDDPPKLHKCDKCDGPRFHNLFLSRMIRKDACGVCQWCSDYRTYGFLRTR